MKILVPLFKLSSLFVIFRNTHSVPHSSTIKKELKEELSLIISNCFLYKYITQFPSSPSVSVKPVNLCLSLPETELRELSN